VLHNLIDAPVQVNMLLAVKNDRVDIVRALQDMGIGFNFTYEDKSFPFVVAEQGSLKTLNYLLDQGVDFENRDNAGMNIQPIHGAASNGHVEVVRRLLDSGISVESKAVGQVSLLSIAALKGDVDLVKLCLEYSAHVNCVDEDNENAFYAAAGTGNLEILQLLADHNADLDVPNKNGLKPSMIAQNNGHTKAVELITKLISAQK
jgi:ankyrin repeat protein